MVRWKLLPKEDQAFSFELYQSIIQRQAYFSLCYHASLIGMRDCTLDRFDSIRFSFSWLLIEISGHMLGRRGVGGEFGGGDCFIVKIFNAMGICIQELAFCRGIGK